MQWYDIQHLAKDNANCRLNRPKGRMSEHEPAEMRSKGTLMKVLSFVKTTKPSQSIEFANGFKLQCKTFHQSFPAPVPIHNYMRSRRDRLKKRKEKNCVVLIRNQALDIHFLGME